MTRAGSYRTKYLKYKRKYLRARQRGGAHRGRSALLTDAYAERMPNGLAVGVGLVSREHRARLQESRRDVARRSIGDAVAGSAAVCAAALPPSWTPTEGAAHLNASSSATGPASRKASRRGGRS